MENGSAGRIPDFVCSFDKSISEKVFKALQLFIVDAGIGTFALPTLFGKQLERSAGLGWGYADGYAARFGWGYAGGFSVDDFVGNRQYRYNSGTYRACDSGSKIGKDADADMETAAMDLGSRRSLHSMLFSVPVHKN
jgi:hypothetical protein